MNKNKLYTLILEFNGGTYISQILGIDEIHASRVWAKTFEFKKIKSLSMIANSDIETQLDLEEVTAINNCKNVWMMGLNINGFYSLIHIIKTDEDLVPNIGNT